MLMFKNSFREIKQLLHPAAVIHVRLGGDVVPKDILNNVLSFIVLYVGGIGLGTMIMFILGLDLLSAFSAAIASIGNIGPAFGSLGPAGNYGGYPWTWEVGALFSNDGRPTRVVYRAHHTGAGVLEAVTAPVPCPARGLERPQ